MKERDTGENQSGNEVVRPYAEDPATRSTLSKVIEFFVGFFGVQLINESVSFIINRLIAANTTDVSIDYFNRALLILISILLIDVILTVACFRYKRSYAGTGILIVLGVTFLVSYACGTLISAGT